MSFGVQCYAAGRQEDHANLLRIQALNDRLRIEGLGGEINCSEGILALSTDDIITIGDAIVEFNDFGSVSETIDDHGFGILVAASRVVVFQILYMDREGNRQSVDPSDPKITRRMMIIMLADELLEIASFVDNV